MFTSNGAPNSTENQFTHSELNPNNISAQFTTPLIRTSLLSSLNAQHQPITSIVISNASLSTSQMQPIQPPFSQLTLPPNGVPWKCPEWMLQRTQHGAFKDFNSSDSRLPFKRKASSDMDSMVKAKQLITDKKMAAYLNKLHISSEFTAHDVKNTATNLDVEFESTNSETLSLGRILTTQDIEEKLKQAQRITICDEIRNLQDEPILPQSILDQFEKPCKALVLWQPPQKLSDFIVSKSKSERENGYQEKLGNTSSEAIDPNSEALMELDN